MKHSELAQPIQRDTLTNVVMDEIKKMILDGRVNSGDYLPAQAELAKGFQIGLSTVREAIRGLALMGIVEPLPGRGTRVTADAPIALRMLSLLRARLDELDPQKIHEARRAIEVEMTGLAAERATPQDIVRIEKALVKMQQTIEHDGDFVQADLEFHLAVAQAAKNRLMADYYFIAHEMLAGVIQQVAQAPGAKQRGLEMQRKILQAIKKRDMPQARQYADDNLSEWSAITLSTEHE
jgi:GntR family transcriptional repressor for pyruvate dehydrogenase complex